MNALFSVEYTDVVSTALIMRVINKNERKYIDINVSYIFKLNGRNTSLPYYVVIEIRR